AAEQTGIGQCPLDRVVLPGQRLAKLVAGHLEWFHAPTIEHTQCVLAAYQLNRCTLLRSRFGKEQGAVLELEDGQQQLRSDSGFFTSRTPTQSSGDHQVNDEENAVIEDKHDPF